MTKFKTQLVTVLGLAALLLSPAWILADDLPTADQVLADAIKAAGGKEAHDKIKSRVTESKLVITAAGMEAKVVNFNDGSNSLQDATFEGLGQILEGQTGGVAWAKDPMTGARVLKGSERAFAQRNSRLHPILDVDQFYKEKKCEAIEKVGDVDCFKLAMTPKDGKVEYWFFDKNTYLAVRMKISAESPMGVIEITVDLSDYRDVDGVKIPFMAKIDQGMQKLEMVTTKVEHNVEIAADKFALPAEIKALIEKAKAKEAEKTGEEVKQGVRVGG